MLVSSAAIVTGLLVEPLHAEPPFQVGLSIRLETMPRCVRSAARLPAAVRHDHVGAFRIRHTFPPLAGYRRYGHLAACGPPAPLADLIAGDGLSVVRAVIRSVGRPNRAGSPRARLQGSHPPRTDGSEDPKRRRLRDLIDEIWQTTSLKGNSFGPQWPPACRRHYCRRRAQCAGYFPSCRSANVSRVYPSSVLKIRLRCRGC